MNPWAVLRIPETATTDMIKTAFRKAVLKHHPDRGGKIDDFKRVYAAYELAKKLVKGRLPSGDESLNEWVEEKLREGEQYVDAWNRVPSGVKLCCTLLAVAFFPFVLVMGPGIVFGTPMLIYLVLSGKFDSDRDSRLLAFWLMAVIGFVGLAIDMFGKINFYLIDHYSRLAMKRLSP